MGVVEHPVHDKVRQAADFKYGCHSAMTGPLKPNGYYAPTIRETAGAFVLCSEFIEHRMSTACRNFYLWDSDAGCAGCSQPKGTAYAEEMKGLK